MPKQVVSDAVAKRQWITQQVASQSAAELARMVWELLPPAVQKIELANVRTAIEKL